MKDIPRVTKTAPCRNGKEMIDFLRSCSAVLEELSVGEFLQIHGFESRQSLDQFEERAIFGQNPDKNYAYQANEADLTYNIRRTA